MFQIAAAYAMSRKLNYNLLFKLNQFSGCRQGKHPSTYYSNIFQSINFVEKFPPIELNIPEVFGGISFAATN